ncbi:MAG: Arginine--tRNA ligase [Tenericutes bacterium ADurb.Bin239]|nr:MAG: Arginine--tRNA ligase [Tenericutes bacterium ADurb.Bin239]
MIDIYLQQVIKKATVKLGLDIDQDTIVIETSKDSQHGDYATNIAMQLARPLRKNPREVASLLIETMDKSAFDKVEVAGPGFINFFLKPETLSKYVATIFKEGSDFGKGAPKGKQVNIEFVSANPTGKLHLGHARGAAVGDSLARLFIKSGYDVVREFYVNDAGVQINNLGASLYVRYLNLFGIDKEIPEDGYHSADLIAIAKSLKTKVGDKYVKESEAAFDYFKLAGTNKFLDIIKEDLHNFDVTFDVYTFETKVKAGNVIPELLEKLEPYTYLEEGATFLKTSDFGDDKDRVIVKSNGEHTYFLPDIAYHLDKLKRGSSLLIDVLGADHHGYIGRMKAALQMFGYPEDSLEVQIIQMVRIIQDGQELKMSKRTGNAITLEELCEEIGVDAARYFFIAKSASTHFDFDLDLALEQSSANPVYYAQYAHARLSSVLARGAKYKIDKTGKGLVEPAELNLIKQLIAYPSAISDATMTREPYKIANYIQRLASLVHTFYTEARILDESNVALTSARLGLSKAAQIVLKDALTLLGVSAPETM